MNYWQIASGSRGREYTDQFIRFGMAFVGGDDNVAAMSKVKEGDRVLLKRGMYKIVAAGEVINRDGRCRGQDDKEWLRDFDGWDLRAYCFVDWHEPDKPFETEGLTRATIQRVKKKNLKEICDSIIKTVPAKENYDPEPETPEPVEDAEILSFLIQEGLRPASAEDLTAAFNRIRLLAKYYYDEHTWENIREHETRTFLIIPLLLALGWAEQQIKIELPVAERQRADIACFSKPYQGNNDDCTLLIETKGFVKGLDYAQAQAREYAKHFPNCQVVLVSNGYCYKAFRRNESGSFSRAPSAYLNLLKPRKRYPLDPKNVDGSLEALRLLLPYHFAR
jgi:hypothetical protein